MHRQAHFGFILAHKDKDGRIGKELRHTKAGYFTLWAGYCLMRINLIVPFKENSLAKKFGARWDSGRKTWYVEDKENLYPFLRWMPKHLTRPTQRSK